MVGYALDDVRDVAFLSALACRRVLSDAMLPRSFQRTATAAPAARSTRFLLRTYLAARQAVPSRAVAAYPGGWSGGPRGRHLRPVVKCDVESLYPAIMLTGEDGAASDTLGVMLPLLRTLTDAAAASEGGARRDNGALSAATGRDAKQSFKV